MEPERAFQEQIEKYRRMTGEQRLAIALELHELSCNVAREGIRHQNPAADARFSRFKQSSRSSCSVISRQVLTVVARGARLRPRPPGLTYYLTGSMASNYWGIPRTTHDLDFVIQLPPSAMGKLLSGQIKPKRT